MTTSFGDRLHFTTEMLSARNHAPGQPLTAATSALARNVYYAGQHYGRVLYQDLIDYTCINNGYGTSATMLANTWFVLPDHCDYLEITTFLSTSESTDVALQALIGDGVASNQTLTTDFQLQPPENAQSPGAGVTTVHKKDMMDWALEIPNYSKGGSITPCVQRFTLNSDYNSDTHGKINFQLTATVDRGTAIVHHVQAVWGNTYG